ncbi:MAG TPA: hypothetical protein VNO17_07835 [Actinomycetota bacterium]|nr:hypothetical protein [Actinomycetota bacterium]
MKRYMILIVAMIAASCATTSDRDLGSADRGGGEEPDAAFLAKPLGDLGVEVTSLAQARLPFEPLVPERLGAPVRIVATTGGPQEVSVAWVFDHPTLGEFAVVERVDDWTEAGLKLEAASVPSPGCTTVEVDNGEGKGTVERCASNNSELIKLADGQDALLTAGESFSVVTWIEPLVARPQVAAQLAGFNVVVDVMGPASGFTTDQAIEAANRIVQ